MSELTLATQGVFEPASGVARAGLDLLMIDNYDSFTYNLVQYFLELGARVKVFRNDEIDLEGVLAAGPSHVVLSLSLIHI